MKFISSLYRKNLCKGRQKRIWENMSFPENDLDFLLSLYEEYESDLRLVKESQKELYFIKDKLGLVPQLGDMEAEITYLLVRHSKPLTVVEISPASGWSTSWILNALLDNGVGKLYSYDLVDDSTRVIPENLSENRWNFYQGDVKDNLGLLPKKIDYLFIDSDHSKEFANWYLEYLFPLAGKGVKTSVHDILKLSSEPGWGEESLILCAWLAERNIPCMTSSRALKDKGYNKIMNLRIELGLNSVIHTPDYNSMIYFTL